MKDQITTGLSILGLTPPDNADTVLAEYGRLLLEQYQVMNLTAITDPAQVAALHFLDSAALLTLPGISMAGKSLIDVGTGTGFPGLPLRILEPTLHLTLLDSLGKRINWLAALCEQLGVQGVTCLHARAEEQAFVSGFRDSFDFAVSRAVASMGMLCELCLPYVKVGGYFLAMKSMDCGEEVAAAVSAIRLLGGRLQPVLEYQIPGTDVRRRVIVVQKLFPTPAGYPRRWAKMQKAPL